jgi:ketohexokinase
VPHYPDEDEKLRASKLSRRRGGNCPNTLEVLGQLLQHGPSSDGASLNLISVLPSLSSVASNRIQGGLGDLVRLKNCIYREQFSEPASSYIIMSQATGSRTIVNYNELPEMTHAEFVSAVEPLSTLAGTPWFHFEVC